MSRYIVATDGACMRNPGPAGWAWVGEDGRWAAGSLAAGTNNIGELLAVLYAIRDHAARGGPARSRPTRCTPSTPTRSGWTRMSAAAGRPAPRSRRRTPTSSRRSSCPGRASRGGAPGCRLRARARARRAPPQRLGRRARGARVAARRPRPRRRSGRPTAVRTPIDVSVDAPKAGEDKPRRPRTKTRRVVDEGVPAAHPESVTKPLPDAPPA